MRDVHGGPSMPEHARLSSVYRVDRNFRILSTNRLWNEFARENGAAGLTGGDVLGTTLWQYIGCVHTRHIYRLLVKRAQASGRIIGLPFRCDSPDRRRFMHIDIVPLARGQCEFRTFLLKEEVRSPVALIEPNTAHGEEFITMCSWCKKVFVEPGGWLQVEEAVRTLRLFGKADMPAVSHGICPSCYDWVLDAIRRDRGTNR